MHVGGAVGVGWGWGGVHIAHTSVFCSVLIKDVEAFRRLFWSTRHVT
jgi:hypothetical protein